MDVDKIRDKMRKLNNLKNMVVITTGEMKEIWMNKWSEMIVHIREELGLKKDGRWTMAEEPGLSISLPNRRFRKPTPAHLPIKFNPLKEKL